MLTKEDNKQSVFLNLVSFGIELQLATVTSDVPRSDADLAPGA